MVIQNQTTAGLVDRGDDTVRPIEQTHRRVIVNGVEGKKAGLRHLLLGTDHHKTGDRPTGRFSRLIDRPR